MTPRDRLVAALSELSAALLEAFAAVQPVTQPPVVPPPTIPPPAPVPVPVPPPVIIPPTGHPRIMLGSQGPRLRASLSAGTPEATRWRKAVDSWLTGADLWGFDAWNGALLSSLTGDSRYAAKAVATIDAQVTAAEQRIAAGQQPEVAGDSYLQVGEMIGDLALVYDWCAPLLTTAQRTRWTLYANQAVWNVWNHAIARWGTVVHAWTGWAVDDSSNNYYYSFLRATMLLGLATQNENPQAQAWLTMFRDTKLLGQLIPTFNTELVGGGSREGTGYGVALRNLFELYALWQWSTGENLADKTPHTRASILTMLASIVPTLDHKAPIGDQSRDSTAALFDYERAYLLELCALYPSAPESAWAIALLNQSNVASMQSSFMLGYDFVYGPSIAAVTIGAPLVRYAPGIGQIYARTSWAKDATWLSLIAGPFTQSHAHQDQGSLMLYKSGWLAYDAVIDSKGGVRQSGSLVGLPEAHSLVRITDSAGHTLSQRDGTAGKVLALHVGAGYVFACVDTTAVYGSPLVTLCRRQVLWLQPDVVVVHDHVVTAVGTTQIGQWVVPTQPTIGGLTALVTVGAHSLRATRVSPVLGNWTTFDFRSNSDQTGGWRIDQQQPGGDRTYLTVLSIDGAASSAVPTVAFADVGVTFPLAGKTVTLGAGVDAL